MNKEAQRVLIVDDLSDWRATLSGLLRDAHYQVEVAGSTSEALELLPRQHFDAAVIDIRLVDDEEGNAEGLSLAGTIREQWPGVKIVMITGYSKDEYLKRAFEADQPRVSLVDDYVLKSDTDELVHRLERALQ